MLEKVFEVVCPFNDARGKDAWTDAIEEWLHNDIDIKLSSQRNSAGFPKSTIDEWEKELRSGGTWITWYDFVVEDEGLDLSEYDLKPLKLSFATIALAKLKSIKEEFGAD